jgi:Ni/Co efflux regulator RcnB
MYLSLKAFQMNSKFILCAIVAASMLASPLAIAKGDSGHKNQGRDDHGQRDDTDRRGHNSRAHDRDDRHDNRGHAYGRLNYLPMHFVVESAGQ